MKLIKNLDVLSIIFSIITVISYGIGYFAPLTSEDKVFSYSLAGCSFAAFALIILLRGFAWRKQYDLMSDSFTAANTTIENHKLTLESKQRFNQELEIRLEGLRESVNQRDNQIRNLEEECKAYSNKNKELISRDEISAKTANLIHEIEEFGKPVAITKDNGIYYTFEAKKEGGLTVTKVISKTKTKVDAELGIDLNGIVYHFADGQIKVFNPLNVPLKEPKK